MEQLKNGTLYLCATPIGNLEDISLRALHVLEQVNLIAAEDTRRSRKLLSYYGIHTPLTSYHKHNKAQKIPYLLTRLHKGDTIALVSDAGMPAISDPGAKLVQEATTKGIPVVPVPGATAALAALVVSGLPTDRFAFEGFLPRKNKERRQRLQEIKNEKRTMIFYEAPHRLLKTLQEMGDALGENRQSALVREVTKVHEETIRATLGELRCYFDESPPKGEITLIVEGWKTDSRVRHDYSKWIANVEKLIAEGVSKKEAIKKVAQSEGVSKREVYAAQEGRL